MFLRAFAMRFGSSLLILPLLLSHHAQAQEGDFAEVDRAIEAIYDGKAELLKQMLADGLDPNCKDEFGDPLLFHACDADDADIAQLLIDHKADVNARDSEFLIPVLSNACATDNVEIVNLLIKHGAKLDLTDKFGSNALEEAAYCGCNKTAARMRELGLKTRWPLHVAAGLGELEEVKKLATDKKLLNKPVAGWLDTPLCYAANGDKKNTAEYLLQQGANPNLPSEGGFFPLHYAVLNGSAEICELLLENGALVNARVEDGETALDWVEGEEEVIKVLKKHGAVTGEEAPRGPSMRSWWAKELLKPPAAAPAGS